MQYQSSRDMLNRLDNELYDEAETITLKCPLALPYHVDSESYHRVDGVVEHNGEFFRLVKQKLERDTLYIVFIKDHDSQRIANALSDYVKTFTDKPVDAKQSVKQFSVIKDFLSTSTKVLPASAGWDHDVSYASVFAFFYSISQPHVSPPPRA